ncbi:prenylcysteine oxidase 1 [Trichonephila inaurata madagascariensis]|uniref:Prenylcysteine oxidase 1 n=1 Tax=Trichonephila inaurata madagascariensis TaxID=2747483 RepID=A0A8X6Y2A1_9ARAC|nr:prenylcysteine oxidase 1 [Trichonephila inaurata madagascariensis]
MYKSYLIVCCFCYAFHSAISTNRIPKIGIVGGGIGGTSCAYFLKEVFGGKCNITLFEREIIGGRLQVQNIGGKYYEAGGAVIHPQNRYMVQFLEILGLRMKQLKGSKFGIFNGEKIIFQESDWYFVTIADFFWRYGFSVFELWKDVKSMLEEFSSIYALQEEKYAFTTVNGLLEYMSPSFKNMTQETLSFHLEKKGYSKRLLDELVQSIMMVNYGQTNNISAFAGYVSLAGADPDLWSVDGGNKLVPSKLVTKSKAQLIHGDVSEIVLKKDGSYELTYVDESGLTTVTEGYDIIVLAAPLIKGKRNIKFTNFQKDFDQYEASYHQLTATFVKGKLNPVAFKSPYVPDEILTFNPDLLFNSIGKVTAVNENVQKETSDVYKIFSNQPLLEKEIDYLFENVDIYKEIDWLAYPQYNPPEKLAPFFLYPGLYYINGIELAASAMEMSCIGSKNVALLAFNLWNNLIDKVDYHKRSFKDEL